MSNRRDDFFDFLLRPALPSVKLSAPELKDLGKKGSRSFRGGQLRLSL
jgi:hypothetical protein